MKEQRRLLSSGPIPSKRVGKVKYWFVQTPNGLTALRSVYRRKGFQTREIATVDIVGYWRVKEWKVAPELK